MKTITISGMLMALPSAGIFVHPILAKALLCVSLIGMFPVLLIGFHKGFYSSLLAIIIGFGVITVLTLLGTDSNFLLYTHQALLVLVLVRFSSLWKHTEDGKKEWYPSGHILSYLIGISVFVMLFQIMISSGPIVPDDVLKEMAKEIANNNSGIEEKVYSMLKRIVFFYPSIATLSTLILVLINGLVALSLAVKTNTKKREYVRPLQASNYLSLPGYYLWVVAGAAALTAFDMDSPLGLNVLMVLCMGFFLVGLSLAHEIIRTYKSSTIKLVVFYVVMVLFGWPAVAFVALIGLIEPWLRAHPKVLENLKG